MSLKRRLGRRRSVVENVADSLRCIERRRLERREGRKLSKFVCKLVIKCRSGIRFVVVGRLLTLVRRIGSVEMREEEK